MKAEELAEKSREINIELTPEMQRQLDVYGALLMKWNQQMNLTAISELPQIYEKHFYDCLLIVPYLPAAGRLCDVGSGAGFPGLLVKIVRPALQVTLLEPTQKKCAFLNEVIHQLGLSGIQVLASRAEDYAGKNREQFAAVTARAVAPLPVLAELCVPLVKQGGIFIAMKGDRGLEEAREAAPAMQTLGATLLHSEAVSLPSGDQRINLIYQKQKATPPAYPRAYAKIRKHPLGAKKEQSSWMK